MRGGVNLVGRLSGDFGLAVAARCTARSLIEGGIPVALVDVVFPNHPRSALPADLVPYAWTDGTKLPHDVTVLHDNIEAAALITTEFTATRTAVRAIVPFWELTLIPLHWREKLDAFDVVLYPSQHVRAAFSNSVACALRPITIAPQAGGALPPVPPHMEPPPRTFAFFTSFNPASSVERKNPSAAIHAFARAFAGRSDASLIVNCHNNFGATLPPEQTAAIHGMHPGIRFFDSRLSYESVLAVERRCDAFVSLHRAEGLGLGSLEMMSFGKPVVATDYSSTTDFIDETNGAPVRYALVPVAAAEPVFAPENVGGPTHWADPDIDHAAWWMRRLVDEPDLYARLAGGARATDAARRAAAARAPWLDALTERARAQRGAGARG